MYRISVMTGARSDYGLLKRTLFNIEHHENMELTLVVCGSHLSDNFGNTASEIVEDGFKNYDTVEFSLAGDTKSSMAEATGIGVSQFSKYFEKKRPDLLVLLGDRYEAFAAATAAFILGIPIAHISGGDITEGALDDTFRHCITKMSSLHFPGCEDSRKRIIQMGENPKTVFNVGEPGVENALNTKLISRQELAKNIEFDGIMSNYALVTFHPATMEGDVSDALSQLKELTDAMDEISELNYLVTLANADAGGSKINEEWIKYSAERTNVKVVPSLGVVRYISAMKYAKLVLGNSSSGIVEAPSMKLPTVNIGDRQKGRMQAKSVISCETDKRSIVDAIRKSLSNEFINDIQDTVSPFGDGTSSEKIVKTIWEFLISGKIGKSKSFYEIDFE